MALSAADNTNLARDRDAARAAGDNARARRLQQRMVAGNLRLARRIVWRCAGRAIAEGRIGLDELEQEAAVALCVAVERYDPARGALSTYASYGLFTAVSRARDKAERAAAHVPLTMRTWAEPGEVRLADVIEPGEPDLAAAVDSMRDVARLRQAVAALPERERDIVVRSYGLDGNGGVKLGEIGKAWGISGSRAQQLRSDALDTLKTLLAA
ncbi:MAG: sigma-70 family RNA polymerase sigma factor [Myxococcales bacterium]|nr:sigma-70 family RNA polymerase sigma factor [Myxococcales bacterium]